MSQSSHPILKMPLDLFQAADREVYKIISEFKSGVDAKNFICSAILYYARSPLVLSANALQDKVDALSENIKKLDFSYTALQLEKILSKLDDVSVACFQEARELKQETKPVVSMATMDSATLDTLSSLRAKFKL